MAPPPLPPATPPTPGAQYYYSENGKPAGPYSFDEIRRRIASGTIKPETLIWKLGDPAWVPLKDDKDFSQLPFLTQACSGKHVLMADDFGAVPKGWEGASTRVVRGKLRLRAHAGGRVWYTYGRMLSGDIDICITVQIPRRFVYSSDTNAGVVFAAKDSKDFYAFLIDPSGRAALFEARKGQLSIAVNWHDMPAIRTDPGSDNELRVAIRGGKAMLFVNGVLYSAPNDTIPEMGAVGILAKSEDGQSDSWKFSSLKVTDFP
jgi:hypothetical protein